MNIIEGYFYMILLRKFTLNKVLLITFLMLFSISCKYDEGPLISFIHARYRVTGNYKLDKFYVDDIDITNYYNGLICNSGFSFNIGANDENFIQIYNPNYSSQCAHSFSGNWQLSDNANTLTLFQVFNIPVVGPWGQVFGFDWNIIKLTDDEMHLGGKSYETTYRLEFKKYK